MQARTEGCGIDSGFVGFAINMDVKMVAGDNIRFKITNSSATRFVIYNSDGDTRMSVHLVK